MSTTKINKLSAVYIRVSTQDQLEGLSLVVQEKLCRKRSEEEGYQVLVVLNDGGISGHQESRPGIDRLKELIINKEICAIIALSSDRLYRNSRSHMDLMALIFKHDIKLLYINQASPENNATSIMTDSMLANINQFYRDQISDKVKGALYARVEAGYFPSLPPPGYRNVVNPDPNAERLAKKIIVPDPVSSLLITELFKLYATGVYSVYDLTDLMAERGLRSQKGFKLSPSRVYELLKNRFYLGEVRWGKAFCKKGKHKPLIDEATFNQVQTVMETNNHKACRRRKYKWLLSGFVYCATHARRYVAEWHFKKTGNKTAKAYYHCPNKTGCGKYSEQVHIEGKVAATFKNLQFSEEFTNLVIEKTKRLFLDKRKTYEGRRQGLVNKKTALECKRKVAEDKLFEGVIKDEDFSRIRSDISTDLRQIDDELATLEDQKEIDVDVAQEVLLLTRDIYKAYKKASFNLKRQYLSFFWERFEVADGVILRSVSSPLFDELLKAEEAFYKIPKSKNRENSIDSGGVILTNFGLAWLDAFRTFDWKKAFPCPDVAIKHVNELLALV